MSRSRVWIIGLVAAGAAAGALVVSRAGSRVEPATSASAPALAPASPKVSGSARPEPGAPLVDPLAPERKLWRLPGELPGDFYKRRPGKDFQHSRGVGERGGVLPCEAPDPGLGVYDDWIHVRPMGQFVAPRAGALAADGSFDLVVHFHGHRPARKEIVRTGEDLVFMGVSLGIGAAYGQPFSDPKLFQALVSGVERKLSQREGRAARVRRLALSSWSRGYEAIAEILQQPLAAKVDALILLDSLHASRDALRARQQLAPFIEFARRASRGERFFFASHSSIDPPDYASSTESVHALVHALGGRPERASRKDPLGLELIELYTHGSFFARGYAGNGKLDHCAHFGVYPDALRALARRWRGSP